MIHPSAVIDEGATVAKGVEVGPHSYVAAGATLSPGCRLGANVVVYGGVTLGRNCRVHAGAVIGDEPQDKAFKDVKSFVEIGDDCVLREGVTVHRGTEEGTVTRIGNRCFLMAFSHFAHNVVVADDVIVANGAMLGGYVQVGAGAFISGNAMLHQFVKVGRLVMVGGGSGISKDLPPFCMTLPCQLNTVIGLNMIGMRRSGMQVDERKEAQRAFKVLFLSGFNATQARTRLDELFDRGPGKEFADFLRASDRGICGCAIQRNVSLDV